MATGQRRQARQGRDRGTSRTARRFPLLIIVGAVALIVLGVTALLPRSTPAKALACAAPATGATGLAVGQCAPDFALSDLHGNRVSLAALRGHPVLLHFWAVGCSTCRAEYPDFSRAVATYRPKGLDVLAVDA